MPAKPSRPAFFVSARSRMISLSRFTSNSASRVFVPPMSPARIMRRHMLAGVAGGFKLAHQAGEVIELEMRVQAAGVGQHPKARVADRLVLRPDLGLGSSEGRAVRADAEEREELGLVLEDLRLEALAAARELRGRELVGGGGPARDDVRDAQAHPGELALVE